MASLVVLYVALHAYITLTTVGPARDGARYLEFAVRLETEPWGDVLRTSPDHPGYPVVLHAAFAVAKAVGWESPWARVVTAQIVTAVAGLAIVVLSYQLMLEAWGHAVSWPASIAFVLLPVPARNMSDVLSDPLFAALGVATALFVLKGFVRGQPRHFFFAGLATALAYCVRVDALVLLVVASATLGFTWCFRRLRAPLGATGRVAAFFLFLSPVITVVLVFFVIYGEVSPKPASDVLLSDSAAEESAIPDDAARLAGPVSSYAWNFAVDSWKFVEKVGRQVQYLHMFTCLAGLFYLALRPRAFTFAGLLFLTAVLVYWLVGVRLLQQAGYFTARYVSVLIPFVVGFGIYGTSSLAQALANGAFRSPLRRFSTADPVSEGVALDRKKGLGARRLAIALIVCGSAVLSIPSHVKNRLHEHRYGVIEAGKWIAAQAEEPESISVYDPYFYPTFLSGLRDRTVTKTVPKDRQGVHYIVIKERDLTDRTRAKIRGGGGRRVKSFPRSAGGDSLAVHVYRVD